MKTIILAAALAAALAPTAADAQKRRDIRVPVADLDLRTSDGLAVLDKRLRRAAAIACGTAYPLDEVAVADMNRCRADALARATATREAVLERARARQLAAAEPLG